MREAAAAILFDPSGRLLLQLRDNIPNILYPGMIGFFGGHREGNETFLECVVREIHEELSFICRQSGPDLSPIMSGPISTCEAARFTRSFSWLGMFPSRS